jgi:hypothetical protein
MKTITLAWKDFNVNLETVQVSIKALEPDCCGLSANSGLDIHINNDEVSQDSIDLIQAYWDDITLSSSEATTYRTAQEIKDAVDAKQATDLAAATVILKGLGLTDDQIAALRG